MYTIKYKAPWWPFARKVKKVTSHWLDSLATQAQMDAEGFVPNPRYWGVRTEDDRIRYIPISWFFQTEPDWIIEEKARQSQMVNK